MKKQTHSRRSGVVSIRLLAGIACICLVPLLLFAAGPAYPAWWTYWGVIVQSGTANDYAPVNQGQVKNLAISAVAEFDQNLSQFGGAGPVLDQLYLTLSGTTATTNDYAPVNNGQLKNLASPFYDRLIQVGYTSCMG